MIKQPDPELRNSVLILYLIQTFKNNLTDNKVAKILEFTVQYKIVCENNLNENSETL